MGDDTEGGLPGPEDLYALAGFRASPFSVVPNDESSKIWADRSDAKHQMDRLLLNMRRGPTSRVYLVWGWWGAGKTHWLRNLAWRARSKPVAALVSYVEVPPSCSDFRTLYQDISQGILSQASTLTELFAEVLRTRFKGSERKFCEEVCPTLQPFVVALGYLGSAQTDLAEAARQWLTGSRLDPDSKRRLQQRGLFPYIDSDERAILALRSITRLLSFASGDRSLLVLLDEYQHVSHLRNANKREALQSSVVELFNKCETNLTLVLAYSARTQDPRGAVHGALISRMGAIPPIELGVLTPTEATKFVEELFAAYRLPGHPLPDGHFPFTRESVDRVVNFMAGQDPPWLLKPRNLIQVLDRILSENEDLVTGSRTAIGPDVAERTLLRIRDHEPHTVEALKQEE